MLWRDFGGTFTIVGPYTSNDHALLLVKLAKCWATNSDGVMSRAMAILSLVAKEAARPDVSAATLEKLRAAVDKLWIELLFSPLPELNDRAEQLWAFLARRPFGSSK